MANPNTDFNCEVGSAINNTVSLYFNKYKSDVQHAVHEVADKMHSNNHAIALRSLTEIDTSELAIPEGQCELNLGNVKKDHTSNIDSTSKVFAGLVTAGLGAVILSNVSMGAVVVGTVAAGLKKLLPSVITAIATRNPLALLGTKFTSSPCTAATVAAFLGGLGKKKNIINAGASGIVAAGIQNPLMIAAGATAVYKFTENATKCILNIAVPAVAEKLGKPMRERKIRECMNSEVIPYFEQELKAVSDSFANNLSDSLNNEASYLIEEKKNKLEDLRAKNASNKAEYDAFVKRLAGYKKELA